MARISVQDAVFLLALIALSALVIDDWVRVCAARASPRVVSSLTPLRRARTRTAATPST
jgi:hypothetical protein